MNIVTLEKDNINLVLPVSRLKGEQLDRLKSTTLSDWESFLMVRGTFNTEETRDLDSVEEYKCLTDGSKYAVYISEIDYDTRCYRVVICHTRSGIWFCLGNYNSEYTVHSISDMAIERLI